MENFSTVAHKIGSRAAKYCGEYDTVYLSVCSHISKSTWPNFANFYACCPLPQLCPSLEALRFHRWHNGVHQSGKASIPTSHSCTMIKTSKYTWYDAHRGRNLLSMTALLTADIRVTEKAVLEAAWTVSDRTVRR